MAINVFEGARRIAKLISWLMVVVAVVLAVENTTYVELNYYISRPGTQAVRTDSVICDFQFDESDLIYLKTSSGKNVRVALCFVAQDFWGQMLIPYEFDLATGTIRGAPRFHNDVKQYVSRVKNSFRLAPDDEEWADKSWRWEKFKSIAEIAFWLLISLALFQLFVWIVGWVVRGFMGIPQKQDRRE